ncbi:unnamed protein product [Mytilus coruscus]|uniref:ZP domain-containing protein n=1 Tax=Mytilus coruscus TaxID=42192 RepID=A0A6J8ALB2_MYTCO|nr:unnamed protein product [Mytilus coruscus]
MKLGECPKVIEFETCDSQSVTAIKVDDISKVHILVNKSNNLYCKPNDASLTNCYTVGNLTLAKLPQPLNVLYEEEKDLKIIGGQKVFFYELTCKDGPRNLTAIASFRTNKTDTTITRTANTELTNALQLKMSSSESELEDLKENQIGVGDELYLFMIVPDGHSVQPEMCTAYPKTKTAIVQMWENTGNNNCNESDSALIDNKWSGNLTVVHIKMYGFRFVDSQDVTINCSALVCPDANGCQKFCVDSTSGNAGRRRRNAVINKNEEKTSASVTFHVSSQKSQIQRQVIKDLEIVYCIIPRN